MQVPCLASSRKEQSLHTDSLGGNFGEGPYAYAFVDLYTDLCGEETSWSVAKTANGNSVNIRTGFFDKFSRKTDLLNSSDTTNTSNIARDGQLFLNTKREVLYPAKHSMVPRIVADLDALEEENDNDSKSISSEEHNLQVAFDSLEKNSDSTGNEVTNFSLYFFSIFAVSY